MNSSPCSSSSTSVKPFRTEEEEGPPSAASSGACADGDSDTAHNTRTAERACAGSHHAYLQQPSK